MIVEDAVVHILTEIDGSIPLAKRSCRYCLHSRSRWYCCSCDMMADIGSDPSEVIIIEDFTTDVAIFLRAAVRMLTGVE